MIAIATRSSIKVKATLEEDRRSVTDRRSIQQTLLLRKVTLPKRQLLTGNRTHEHAATPSLSSTRQKSSHILMSVPFADTSSLTIDFRRLFKSTELPLMRQRLHLINL
jgi:hypothetical protein